ncbi:MAG: hypothetical protein MHPSP_000019, partial [Paramarteilia canceri]
MVDKRGKVLGQEGKLLSSNSSELVTGIGEKCSNLFNEVERALFNDPNLTNVCENKSYQTNDMSKLSSLQTRESSTNYDGLK